MRKSRPNGHWMETLEPGVTWVLIADTFTEEGPFIVLSDGSEVRNGKRTYPSRANRVKPAPKAEGNG